MAMMTVSGVAASAAGPGSAVQGGRFTEEEARSLRRLLCRALHEAGELSKEQIAQVTGLSRSTVVRDLAVAGPAPESPSHRSRSAGRPSSPEGPAALTAGFLAELRRDYGAGATTEEGRAIGERAEVRAWLDSLGGPAR